jgi:SAM-dependent methyltransferase
MVDDGGDLKKTAFTNISDWVPTDAFLYRLCDLYARASAHYDQPDESMWGDIDQMKREIHHALAGRDIVELRKLVTRPSETDLYFGMDTLARYNMPHFNDAGGGLASIVEAQIVDTLTSLSEVSGARRFWNFESYPNREPFDANAILRALDDVLGITLKFPNPFPKEFGLVSDRGVIGHRVPTAIYHALKARELCLLIGGTSILEIGAGVGRTAFYAYSLGYRNYTIVDLPISLVGQAVYLSAALGEDSIWLDGELTDKSGKICLASPPTLLALPDSFDVILNIDSFTEMPLDQSKAYFRFAADRCKALYSMNHELNPHRTMDIASLAGVRTHPIRHASAFRRGYVEELYFFDITRHKDPM